MESMSKVEELKPDDIEYEVLPGVEIVNIDYFEKLNVILVGTVKNDLLVVDPTLGDVVYKSKIKDETWDMCVSKDRVIIASKSNTGIRSDYNGILLLDTILQSPVQDSALPIEFELSRTEVESLLQSGSVLDFAKEPDSTEVIKQLKEGLKELETSTVPLYSVKKEKWNTVKLHLPHSVLKSTFQLILTELWKKNAYLPQLSIAASIIERLNMLLPSERTDLDLPADRTQMFSEFARLNTFINWPHQDYRWAHPLKMAQAGFYHNPNTSIVEDRVMCFACNVCLVSWEPTDEPWSEHERHSPFCPFVRGEHTHNVPLSLSYATAPAVSAKKTTPLGKSLIGRSTDYSLVVIGFTSGFVFVCDTLKNSKEVVQFDVSLRDIQSIEPLTMSAYSDICLKPKEAWVMDTSDTIPEPKIQETLEDKLTLSAIALLGNSSVEKQNSSAIVVGGTLSQFVVRNEESSTWEDSATVLVYGLIANKTDTNSNEPVATDSAKPKNTGTKQETSQYDEDLFCAYPDVDLLSDGSMLSDVNMAESPTTYANAYLHDSDKFHIEKGTQLKTDPDKAKSSYQPEPPTIVTLTQKLLLPSGLSKCIEILHIIPTPNGNKLVISVKRKAINLSTDGAVMLYNIIKEESLLKIKTEPVQVYETMQDLPVDMCFVASNDIGTFACVLKSGSVLLLSAADLSLVSMIKPSEGNTRITSISYSTGLERLCCGTNIGSIVLYNPGTDSETTCDQEVPTGIEDSSNDTPDLLTNQELTALSMQHLLKLTVFETVKPCFTVNAPSCWTKVIQAQKDRKHPQHLQHPEIDSNLSTLSWRLQKTKNSRKEHLFEITLPKATYVGHFDIKFQLQQGCVSAPNIVASLYQVSKNSLLKPPSPSKNSDSPLGAQGKSKITSSEFLNSVNAEIVAGPLEFSTHIDLTAQGGNLVMSSPLLLLSKTRHFYLHIKSTKSPFKHRSASEGSKISKPSKSQTKSSASKGGKVPNAKDDMLISDFLYTPLPSVNGPQVHTPMQKPVLPSFYKPEADSDKRKEFGGCDWIHELSITVRQAMKTSIPNEALERKNMLESTEFLERLVNTVIFQGDERTYIAQTLALELLVWIGAINLGGPQIGKRSYQRDFVRIIKTKLQELILHGIIYANRSTAHKCAKLLIVCIDIFGSVDNSHVREESGFPIEVLMELMNLLPYTISCESAGSLQWFFLLLSRVRRLEPTTACEALLNLLNIVSEELFKRNDPMHSLLRTRFGLFGTPFESELFELELPPITKSYSHPVTYTGLGTEHVVGPPGCGAGVSHLWGLKDVDFRDLLVGSLFSTKWAKIGSLSPKQQLHGLLEVEPIHFTCHAASDGTRIEKIDLGFNSCATSIPLTTFEPHTNTSLPTGEGSKKTEPDKMEHMMMLHSLKKLSSTNLGGAETYYDALSDLKFLEENSNVLDVAYDMHNNQSSQQMFNQIQSNASSWKSGILSMVMQDYKPFEVSQAHNPKPLFPYTKPPVVKANQTLTTTGASTSSPSKPSTSATANQKENDGLKLLLSPWQQMMYVPPQQAIVIDRMHSGARRFVVLDFGSPILLTDFVIPACAELVSISIDVWVNREDIDGQRLVVASDISLKSLMITDLQPPVLCRYLKLTAIGRYGMATTKCKIPIGVFYGHTAVLEDDLRGVTPGEDVPVLSNLTVHGHLSVLNYLVEDIGCRYQLACAKLKRLIDHLMKPELSSLDHISYFLPKGKERNRLGLNTPADQAILAAYQECITLQQQFNVAKNVIRRLQKSLKPHPPTRDDVDPASFVTKVCSDKLHFLTEFIVEALLGACLSKFIRPNVALKSLQGLVTQDMCEKMFKNMCVLENGQCQLSTSTLLLRVAGFQPWWGKFLSHTLKTLFSSSNTMVFPQDRVFILMVYLGQRALLSARNSSVLESIMELLLELVSPVSEMKGFIRSRVDMTLLGWVVMYMCLLIDGIYCSFSQDSSTMVKDSKEPKEANYVSPRWDFIQGEISLYKQFRSPQKGNKMANLRRQVKKNTISIKQKLEELDMMQGNFVNIAQMKSAYNNALGSVNFPLPSSQLPKGYKVGACKHLKEALLKKPENTPKNPRVTSSKIDKDESYLLPEIELNVNLSPSLCLALAKGLGALLLKMDTTCHSDVFLVVCKALARVATSCRPAIPLGAIFNKEQVIELLLPAVGSDFVKQSNWSTAWVSHSVMCLMQDLIEGEKLFPNPQEEQLFQSPGLIFNEESFPPLISNAVCMDDLEVNEPMDISPVAGTSGTTSNVSLESDDSECDELMEELVLTPANNPGQTFTVKVKNLSRRIAPCLTSYSTALDSRLETGAESTTELRLRMLAVVDAETLNQSLQSPVEIPEEYMKVLTKQAQISSQKTTNFKCEVPTTFLLSSCFDEIFRMMASENRSISIERVLQLWLSLNFDLQTSSTDQDQSFENRPTIPLSYDSVASLMTALTKSTGVGVQEWGLGFQCLCLAASENPLSSSNGLWLNIITSNKFPQVILKFLSGAGASLQNSSVPAVGPNVCLHFYNFLLRLRQYSNNSCWTPFLKEILLRILSVFLSGPLLTSNFPMDAFNKFLDRVTCQDLSYESLSTVVSIVDYFATALEQFVFYPDKITVRSNAELKGAPPSTTANGLPITNETIKLMKPQNLENLMLKLLSLVTSIVSLPFKSQPNLGEVETSFLSEIEVSSKFSEYGESLFYHIRNFDQEPKTVADVIVQLEPIMMKLLSVLANPKSPRSGSADVQNISTQFDISTPTSITEGIMNLVNKLSVHTSRPSWIVKPIFHFLSKSTYQDLHCPLIVSESFVRMVLNVLSNQNNLVEFVKMDCVESVCQKLVASSRRFFSSSPTFVSILTQFIGRTDPNQIFGQKKLGHETFDLPEGLINVAPLGTISSTNFSAHPSEVLLQATPPHRRARAPVWSYHFYPEEKFLELLISLPCAILLKEIQIVPHISTLSTNSPSALMVEISRDRSQVSTALGPPIQCGGMTTINVNLHRPEVAQTILLRLFKPKDSSNLGLSQIRVLGCTTFSEAALQGLYTPEPAQFLESSAQWMYILDKAIQVSQGDLKKEIIEIAVSTPDILESCYSLLMSPVISSIVQELDLSRLASVLFHFACLKVDVSQQLLKALLGPVQFGFSNAMVTNAHTQGSARLSQLNTVIELIYNLCCNIPIYGSFNLSTLVKWVESRADEASRGNIDMKGVVPAYIQAVAAALWTIAAGHKVDITNIVTPKLLVKLLNWTRVIDPNSELKASIDHMICSVCSAKPWLFTYLMFIMDLIKPMDWTEKDKPIEELLENWNEESVLWDRVTMNSLTQISPYLKSSILMTLARASQSEQCAEMLDASQFLGHLNTAIMDFWNHYTTLWMNANNQIEDSVISTSAFISILEFYQELCRVYKFKTWFGINGSIFWLPILTLLSTLPPNLKTSFFGSLVCDLESAVINFLSKCCWLHSNNQTIIAKCLCEVVVKQKVSSHKAVFLHSMSAFCRRLIIQLLLENEKVVVHIKNKTNSPFKLPVRTLDLKHKHPSMGVKGTDRIFEISSHQYVYDIMKVLEPFGTKLPKFNLKTTPKLSPPVTKESVSSDQKDFNLSSYLGVPDTLNNKRPIKVASKKLRPDGFQENKQSSVDEPMPVLYFEAEEFPGIKVSPELELTTVLAAVRFERDTLLDSLVLIARTEKNNAGSNVSTPVTKEDTGVSQASSDEVTPPLPDVFKVQPLTYTIDVFSRLGGLALLAKNLPVVYPETLRSVGIGSKFTGNYGVVTQHDNKDNPMLMDNDWVKIESADDFYDEMMDSMIASSTPVTKRNVSIAHFASALGIPPHTMSAFGLFLGLPGFSEVLLTDRVGAQCMLRLSMGVTDDADGNDILSNPHAKALSTLPFNVLRCILDILPIDCDKGMLLRRAMISVKATHFILACLAVFTHQNCDATLMPGIHHELVIAATKAQGGYSENKTGKSDDKSHVYWAKGTGFGTGSTVQSWDVELAMQKKKAEEENVTCLLQVLSSYINPNASHNKMEISDASHVPDDNYLPGDVYDLIKCSSLLPAIAGYLRNDSVLDMARHIPLYGSVLLFLRALVSSTQLLPLLLPSETLSMGGNDEQPISVLLCKMKSIVDSYSKRLSRDTKRGVKGKPGGKTPDPELEDEGLAQLIPDIQLTATIVDSAVKDLLMKRGPQDVDIKDVALYPSVRINKSLDERYIELMKSLQFAFFDMIVEEDTGTGIRFSVSHHYEGNIRTNWTRTTPNRLKRLAQESVTLSTSLPIAYGSTIFVRCDTDRLDVMKVLITGPASTPYSNGCFEFDVYFPSDYPTAPMMINLETTGRQRIRFNPNLYTDGKVCLSILNTWHGRPEEKWNPQTGSLLPVLVAIQSLILNAEPYYNEPGYEKSRGTEQGERNSREYNAGIMIATLEWAMLDQIKNPTPCFKEVIHHHFYMKRAEIISQCQQWLQELIETCRHDKRAGKSVTGNLDPVSVFKNNLALLKKEFANMQPPAGLEDLTEVFGSKLEEGVASSGGSTPVTEIQKEKETIKKINAEFNSTLDVMASESTSDTTKTSDNEIDSIVEPF